MNFQRTVLVFFALLVVGKAEIYIVTIDGEPIVSYKGDLDGFEATAMESDEKIDPTRFQLFNSVFVSGCVRFVFVMFMTEELIIMVENYLLMPSSQRINYRN